jgi:hypothetical protein
MGCLIEIEQQSTREKAGTTELRTIGWHTFVVAR